ncbi:MAG: recombination protein O N-terminal domain-containing protein [bacterium]|nr:recombination protein O N-terminal domain-containing protein [bacterium]MDO8742336.1 recombination protein O N-terminal domain-containing protein [bacterium]
MRHKYDTRGIVLSRIPSGEANALVTILTPELGLVYARAQGVRHSGAKLSAALATLAESSVMLVRGKEGWRVVGAVLEENWFDRIANFSSRKRAARISGLLMRLVAGEVRDPALFSIVRGFFEALATLPDDAHEAAEMLAALRALSVLGLDAGEIPGESAVFAAPVLASIGAERTNYITRINRGITASGL